MPSASAPISPTGETPSNRAELFAQIAPFTRGSFYQGGKSFLIDIVLYGAGIAAVVLMDSIAIKLVGGVIAGLSLVNLGSLAHEAAHDALVPSKRANKVMGVVAMTVVFFNYRLWVYDHHVLHHGRTNVRGHNAFSPLSPDEYRTMPPLRQALYRAYRSKWLAGVFLYYLVERWPTVHLYPQGWLPGRLHASAWRYTALIAGYAAALIGLLIGVPLATGGSVAAALAFGFVVPYTIWLTTFAMTVALQHTHPRLPWYSHRSETPVPPSELSVQLLVPNWFNYFTHYALEHPVHHVSAQVPHYHLQNAQATLGDTATTPVIAMKFAPKQMSAVFDSCKLFDFERQVWVDYEGQVTANPDARLCRRATAADEQLPYGRPSNSPGIFFPPDAVAPVPQPSEPVRQESAP